MLLAAAHECATLAVFALGDLQSRTRALAYCAGSDPFYHAQRDHHRKKWALSPEIIRRPSDQSNITG